MRYSVFLLLVGAFVSVLLTPLSIRFALRIGAIDTPDGGRHRHAAPTPRLGGLALYFAAVATALLLLPPDGTVGAWLAGGGCLAALGVTDDLYSLSPRVKAVAMSAVATLPIAFGLSPSALSLGAFSVALPRFFSSLFVLLWVLLLTNAFNLADGSDGLAATLAVIAACLLFFRGGHPATLLVAGAALGFLPYNRDALPVALRRPCGARTFLGDTGALLLGYSLAVLSLGDAVFPLASSLFFALPLFDLLRVFILRLLRGRNPFAADRSHLHHILADRGLSRGAILLLYAILSLGFGVLGLLLLRFPP